MNPRVLEPLLSAVTGFGLGIVAASLVLPRLDRSDLDVDVGAQEYAEGVATSDGALIWASFSDAYKQYLAGIQQTEASVRAHWVTVRQLADAEPVCTIVSGYRAQSFGIWILTMAFSVNGNPGEMVFTVVTDPQGKVAHVVAYK